MVLQTKIYTRPAAATDRNQLAHLIHFGTYVHRHLDWKPPLEWIGKSPFFVAEYQERVVAGLACPQGPPGIAWVRIFVCSTRISYRHVWNNLWPQTVDDLKRQQIAIAAAIPLQKWFRELLSDNGFEHNHNVISLAWDITPEKISRLPPPKPYLIRRMTIEDLPQICDIDSHSFGQLWRNASDSIKLAFQQAMYATVVEKDDTIIGYQITTQTPYGAHLGRLATKQNLQNQGVGYALVHDLVSFVTRQNIGRLSVNTQDDNTVSQSLYHKAGFQDSKEAYPVFIFEID